MNGLYNILKPNEKSSAGVVTGRRRCPGVNRMGAGGTLDPEAAGVLPVMTGKAARLFDYLADKEKEYVAVCAFGTRTDTQDATGAVIEEDDNYPDRETFLKAAEALTGDIIQTPSMFSAIKVGGQPLYLRARKGETVDVPARKVRIDRIELLRETENHGFEIRVNCGRGTYIRTLCEDLGKKCGCPAHMRSLLRTKSGAFTIDNALSLEEAKALAENGQLETRLLPPDYAIGHLPRINIPAAYRKKVENGVKLPVLPGAEEVPEGGPVRIYLDNQFWGICIRRGDELAWKAQIAPEEAEEMN